MLTLTSYTLYFRQKSNIAHVTTNT